ncbi:dGTP triphosphohydrolase [Lysinibacillus capsici]|uniref:dGTP triphosphohydrolase n=1 Tax=Lysinibacillus capsici TaxID=2115968 RepID=UPI002480DB1B|nr:dNTP triphosphohydrolase [Lysinibacillus capsici]
MEYWNNYLSGIRLKKGKVKDRDKDDSRNDYEDDYSRLIFSPSVRRLQDKAQVFPLDSSDFVRTRLTHSLEVSTLGRSIGISVEQKLIEAFKLDEQHRGKISSLLAVAGLIHDLGNPPYGHYGEEAIQSFFKTWIGEQKNIFLTEDEKEDFYNFEGNAQTLRILTKLHTLKHNYGFDLSVASMASIIKYPRSSKEGNKDKSEREKLGLGVSYKKFGYLQAEKERFEQIKEYTNIGDSRHPVSFLLEAADDIAYSAADIEDGCKKGVLNYETILEILRSNLNLDIPEESALFNKFTDTYKEPYNKEEALDSAVTQFRIEAQGFMVKSVVETFVEKHDEIISGEFDKELLKISKAKNVRNAFEKMSEIIFENNSIIKNELAGGMVIKGLLELFADAVISEDYLDSKTKNGKLYKIISNNYRFVLENTPHRLNAKKDGPSDYDKLLLVTDFICGMTDNYALDLYKQLKGINI